MEFHFKLEDIPKMMRSGGGDPWREIALLAEEVLKLKEEINKLKKKTKKVIDDE